jgi:hypothetical protein
MTVVKVLGGYLEVEGGGVGGGQPPGFWGGTPAWPSHPIAPGGGPSQGPGFPTHPIAPGGPPPGFWGGGNMPYPDQGLPGQPPGFWGGSPAWPGHPIAPGGGPSQGPGFATPPIYFPPNAPPTEPPPDDANVEWKTGWSAETGWVTVGVVTPEGPTPTPSQQK